MVNATQEEEEEEEDNTLTTYAHMLTASMYNITMNVGRTTEDTHPEYVVDHIFLSLMCNVGMI